MIRHVSVLTFTDGTTGAQVEAIETALATLPTVIPTLRNYACGRDLGVSEGNAHFVVVADFDDTEGFVTYRDHPEHVRILTEVIRPVLASRAAVQYRVG